MKRGDLLASLSAFGLVLALFVLVRPWDRPVAAPLRPHEVAMRINRAYDGAPPVIPHEVAGLGRSECLDCHRSGDAMAGGKRARITPHPELENCVQCHVPQQAVGAFVDNHHHPIAYPIGLRGQPMGPWLIPHPLTMRENCLGCHGDESNPDVLLTSHPERENCQQCHVPANEGWPGPRTAVTR